MNIQDTTRSLANAVSNIMAGHSIEKVELTEAKETTVPFEKMNILTPDQWDQVQNFKNFDEKEWKWNAIQKKFIRLKKIKEEDVEEGNEFTAAAAKAKLAGKDKFEFDGKSYPVEIEQDAAEKILGKKESTDLEEAVEFWTVTVTKKAGKLFKGQTVDVKASNSAEAIKKGLKQMKVDNPMTVPSGSVDAVLAESLKEATKPSNGTSTVGLDVVDAKSAMKDMKKFKLKAKEGKGNGSADEVVVTGKNADIFKYLTSDYYDMDTDEIEEFYPELYESVDLEEATDTVDINTPTRDAAKRLAKKLANKFSPLRSLTPKGKSVTVPNERAYIRYIESQPEFERIAESVDLEEATMSQGVKTAATQIYSLEKSLKVGSNLNKGINKSLEGKYDADFKKMQKAIGDIVSVWEEIERDFSGMNEVEEPKAQGEKDFKALHAISATDPEEAGNDQPIAPRP
tara:strand:- start:1547 stop:2911 length:1365 start_codon:yes stop_codon:yes gene_type:complete